MNPNLYSYHGEKVKQKYALKTVIEILPNYIQHRLGESTVVIQEDGKGKKQEAAT